MACCWVLTRSCLQDNQSHFQFQFSGKEQALLSCSPTQQVMKLHRGGRFGNNKDFGETSLSQARSGNRPSQTWFTGELASYFWLLRLQEKLACKVSVL
jgi:hypothetical protein